tara:strand:+ start:1032 stop:2138 length:1107 start_codon:yes stop_codon:yes gene_type:complete
MAKIVEPKVDIIGKKKHLYKFTLSNANVSVANSIRRTILTDITSVVIDPDNINIIKNNTQFNNEILCQRLACIPVHIKDLSKSIDNLMLEIHVHNDTDYIKEVTTKDFKLKEPKQNKYLNDDIREAIFPKNTLTGDYLLFSRLKPKISNEIPGETLHIQATFKLASAKDNGAYNVVCSCAYGYSLDQAKIADAEQKLQNELENSNLNDDDVTDKMTNFDNHHKKRYYKENSFDFTMESIGVWKNREIISMACDIIIKKLEHISKLNKEQKIDIKPTSIALKNGYEITLENETYTIGKLIEYVLHYEYLLNKKVLSFAGFLKYHPHDSHSIIRIAFKSDDNTIDYIQDILSQTIGICKNIIAAIKKQFN